MPVFSTLSNMDVRNVDIYKIIFVETVPEIFLILFRYPGVLKDKHNWLGEPGTRPKIPKS